MHLASFFWLGGTRKWPILSLFSFYVSVLLACSSDIFCGCANVFPRETPKEGQVKGRGEGVGRGKRKCLPVFFSPPPSPFPSFSLAPTPLYLKGCYFYSPQCSSVIKSKMAAKTIRTQTSFRPPKIHLQCRLLFYGLFKSVLQRCWLNLGIFPNFHFPSQWLLLNVGIATIMENCSPV